MYVHVFACCHGSSLCPSIQSPLLPCACAFHGCSPSIHQMPSDFPALVLAPATSTSPAINSFPSPELPRPPAPYSLISHTHHIYQPSSTTSLSDHRLLFGLIPCMCNISLDLPALFLASLPLFISLYLVYLPYLPACLSTSSLPPVCLHLGPPCTIVTPSDHGPGSKKHQMLINMTEELGLIDPWRDKNPKTRDYIMIVTQGSISFSYQSNTCIKYGTAKLNP